VAALALLRTLTLIPKKKLARVHFLIYFPEHKNDFLEKSGSENQGPDYYFTGTPLMRAKNVVTRTEVGPTP
jgi:hypothetical protein